MKYAYKERCVCFQWWTKSSIVNREIQSKVVNPWNPPSSLRWRHNERDSVSNHQHHDCLLHRLFRRRSKKTSKFRATGLCVGNSPGTGEFPEQMASYAENVSIWWRHHVARYINVTVCIIPIAIVNLLVNIEFSKQVKEKRKMIQVSSHHLSYSK